MQYYKKLMQCCIKSDLLERLPPWLPLYKQDIQRSRFVVYFGFDKDASKYIIHGMTFTLAISGPKTFPSIGKYLGVAFSQHCRNKFDRWEATVPITYSTGKFIVPDSKLEQYYNKRYLNHRVGLLKNHFSLLEKELLELAVKSDGYVDMAFLPVKRLTINKVCFVVFDKNPLELIPIFNVSAESAMAATYDTEGYYTDSVFLKKPLILRDIELMPDGIFAEGTEVI